MNQTKETLFQLKHIKELYRPEKFPKCQRLISTYLTAEPVIQTREEGAQHAIHPSFRCASVRKATSTWKCSTTILKKELMLWHKMFWVQRWHNTASQCCNGLLIEHQKILHRSETMNSSKLIQKGVAYDRLDSTWTPCWADKHTFYADCRQVDIGMAESHKMWCTKSECFLSPLVARRCNDQTLNPVTVMCRVQTGQVIGSALVLFSELIWVPSIPAGVQTGYCITVTVELDFLKPDS